MFEETEVTEMKKFYQEELDKTLQRLSHIKGVLEKLGTTNQVINIEVKAPLKKEQTIKAVKDKEAPKKPVVRKQSKVKSIWEEMIVKRLKAINKPLNFDELTEEIMAFGLIPKDKFESTKKTIKGVTTRLRRQNKSIQTFSVPGLRVKYIGLRKWFDENGEIKEEFKTRLPIKEKKVVKKRVKTELSKIIKPEGTPPWVVYVVDLLKDADKPLLVTEMAYITMENFKIDKKYFEPTRVAIARTTSFLHKKEQKIGRHLLNGKTPGYYGLPEWFNRKGELKKAYLNKI